MLQADGLQGYPEPVTINISDIENIYGRTSPIAVRINSLWVTAVSKSSTVTLKDWRGRFIQLKYYDKLSCLKPKDKINVTALLHPNDNQHIYLDKIGDIEIISSPVIYKVFPSSLSSVHPGKISLGFEFKLPDTNINNQSVSLLVDGIKQQFVLEENMVTCIYEAGRMYSQHHVRAEVKPSGYPTFIKEWFFTVWDASSSTGAYLGIPHAHTSFSDGLGTPASACLHAIKRNLDYLFITDHSHYLNGVKDGCYEYVRQLGEYVEMPGSQWSKTRQQIEVINSSIPNFTAIRGFEMSCSLGHINVFNTNSYVEGKLHMKKKEDFLRWLSSQENAAAAINHPECIDYSPLLSNKDDLEGILCLIEVGNGTPSRGYMRHERIFFNGLDKGLHWGVLNSQDNHGNDWGDSTNLTGILAPALTPEGIMFALKNRYTYSTETGNLKLGFSIQGFPMGSIITIKEGSRVCLDISATDDIYPIRKLELISNGQEIIDEKYFSDVKSVQWQPQIKVQPSERWYVLKVIHSNEAWGISSPIFIIPTR